MVDSERGVGRPDRALELGRSVDRSTLAADVQVALAIAMSGARLDLGQTDAALAELEIVQLDPNTAYSYSPGLFAAYADVLEDLGRDADSAVWRERAERAEAAVNARDGADDEFIEVVEEEIEDALDELEGEQLEAQLDADFVEALEGDEPVTDEPVTDETVADDAESAEPVTDAADDTTDAAPEK
jgi:23S rRNA pseudouridine2605 synthase